MEQEFTIESELAPQRVVVPGHGGIPLTVWLYGTGTVPLILWHCTGTLARIWEPVIEAIADRFCIYAVDNRGHGDSGKPRTPEAYLWSICGQDVLNVCDFFGLKRVYAVGHSAGASYLCEAAAHRPDLFEKLILIEGIMGPAPAQPSTAMAEAARRRKHTLPGYREALQRFREKPPFNTWHARALECYLRHGWWQDESGAIHVKCPGFVEAWVYEQGWSSTGFETLRRIADRVLLVVGERSEVRPLVDMQHAVAPSARVCVIAEAGHFVPQDNPDAVARLILDYFISADNVSPME